MNYNPKYIYEWPRVAQGIVLGIVFVIVFYVGYLFTITPLFTQLNQAKQQEQELKSQLQLLYKNHVEVKRDLTARSTITNELNQWKNKLALPNELPEVLNQILKIGTQSNVVFNVFSPDKEKEQDAYIKLPIKATVVGTFDQIGDFISQLANMDKLVVIEDFTLSKMNADQAQDKASLVDTVTNSAKLTADMVLNIYEAKPV